MKLYYLSFLNFLRRFASHPCCYLNVSILTYVKKILKLYENNLNFAAILTVKIPLLALKKGLNKNDNIHRSEAEEIR